VAVDNLVEGLAVAGVQPLRVGHGGKVKSRLVEHTLDFKLENHPLRREVNELSGEDERLQKRMDDLQKRVDGVCKGERRDKMQMGLISMERHHKAVKGKLYGVRQQMLQEIVGKADVVRDDDLWTLWVNVLAWY
jgi:hypothetical protein